MKSRQPAMSKAALREQSERLMKDAMERNVSVTKGKTRIEVKCGKCGAPNRVSAEMGQTRVEYKCKECGQLYLYEFFEEIDWVDGEDPQYVTYIPVRSKGEAEEINKVGLWELQTFSPRINKDWPKGKPRRIYWMGK